MFRSRPSLRLALFCSLATACTNGDAQKRAPREEGERADANTLPDAWIAPSSDAGNREGGDAGTLDGGGGDTTIPPHSTKAYKRVLLLGDSFVGLGDGLATALRPRFEREHVDVRTVPWKAIKIIYFADDERVPELLKKWDPDLVILVLGGNDMFVPEPEKHAFFVRKTAKLMRGRDCYWLGPPPWKKSTGILDVIARDASPCTFFDARGLDIERKHDHIHPTNKGGEAWASAFWQFFRGSSGALGASEADAGADAGL